MYCQSFESCLSIVSFTFLTLRQPCLTVTIFLLSFTYKQSSMAYQQVYSPFYNYSFILNNSDLLPGQHPLIQDYNVSPTASFGPDYTCSNCQCYGFPCANCKQYILDGEPVALRTDINNNDNKEFIIDFSDDSNEHDSQNSDNIEELTLDFSSMSLKSQIDFIAAGNISWADVTIEHESD